MKNLIFIFLFTLTTTVVAVAQDECIPFLPKEEGTVLVNKSYNANNELISVLTFRIDKIYNYPSGETMQVDVTLANEKDSVVETGVIDASCQNGTFYMKMSNRALSPKLIELLGSNTTLIESFMGSPREFSSNIYSDLYNGEGETSLSIESKSTDQELIAVRIINREYDKDELIATPAGIFEAVKVTFDFEVTRNEQTSLYKGAEWYAVDAGIIRSETYDQNNKLKNYTLLTSLSEGE